MTTPYFDRLEACRRERGSALCVGIDPRIDRIPASLRGPDVRTTLEQFGAAVHERTRPHAACWKPQIAFFEAHGLPGLTAFAHIVQTIRASGGLVIADAKRGDIGSTAEAYAEAFLAPGGDFEADALTINPYLGRDALRPFVEVAAAHGKGLYILVRTSNPGAGDLQERALADGPKVFERVAAMVDELGAPHISPVTGWSLVGAVVGATSPAALATLREALPRTPFLAPGFGAQGATAADVAAAFRSDGSGAVVNASRSVIHPAVSDEDWPEAVTVAAREAAESIHAATAAS
ncbi:MAG: orotidine-5'-phosphate decarboxylase [Planctomycetota bacterium]